LANPAGGGERSRSALTGERSSPLGRTGLLSEIVRYSGLTYFKPADSPRRGLIGEWSVRAAAMTCALLILFAPKHVAAQEPAAVSASAVDAQPLRPGDVIRLRIWREPDFSGDFPVEANGVAVLPHVGNVDVTGQTAESLRIRLIAAFSEVLQNPSISITVQRRIQVLGAVQKPGLYPVDATMTVSDAIALAGGPTPNGKGDKAVLIRDGQRLTTRLTAGTTLASSQIRSGDQIFVPQRSRWTTERGFFTAVGAALSIAIALIRYR
jgi:polysaccharide biosynthesis/export protein VpsN